MLRKVFRTGKRIRVSLPKDVTDPLVVRDGSDVSVELNREHGQIIIRLMEMPIAVVGVDQEFAH